MTQHLHGPDADDHAEPHDQADHDEHGHGHDHGHSHDHPEGWLRRLVETFVGHSHDPGDSIDDALTGVNPCDHDGEDAHALTRHHDRVASSAS